MSLLMKQLLADLLQLWNALFELLSLYNLVIPVLENKYYKIYVFLLS